MHRILNDIPPEIKQIILSYSRLDTELREQRIRLRPVRRLPSPYNQLFFRNWYYLIDRLPPHQNHAWIYTPRGSVLVWRY